VAASPDSAFAMPSSVYGSRLRYMGNCNSMHGEC
jgi:hypothetical protein